MFIGLYQPVFYCMNCIISHHITSHHIIYHTISYHTLKTKDRKFANFVVISSTVSCRYDDGRQSCQNDDLLLSVHILSYIIHLIIPMHGDVIKWKHFPRYWPFVWGIHRSPVNSPHKGQWRGALMFSFICDWINGWVSSSEAGDLKHHRAHYDVIVMSSHITILHW